MLQNCITKLIVDMIRKFVYMPVYIYIYICVRLFMAEFGCNYVLLCVCNWCLYLSLCLRQWVCECVCVRFLCYPNMNTDVLMLCMFTVLLNDTCVWMLLKAVLLKMKSCNNRWKKEEKREARGNFFFLFLAKTKKKSLLFFQRLFCFYF